MNYGNSEGSVLLLRRLASCRYEITWRALENEMGKVYFGGNNEESIISRKMEEMYLMIETSVLWKNGEEQIKGEI